MTQKEVCNDFLDRTTLSRIEKKEAGARVENGWLLLRVKDAGF
nr:hypothetical protein [Enterococcus faecium]